MADRTFRSASVLVTKKGIQANDQCQQKWEEPTVAPELFNLLQDLTEVDSFAELKLLNE